MALKNFIFRLCAVYVMKTELYQDLNLKLNFNKTTSRLILHTTDAKHVFIRYFFKAQDIF